MTTGNKLVRQRLRKLQVKTSKGVKWIVKRKKPSPAHCATCGNKLHAVPNRNVAEMKKLSKTQKRPERPYGGVLCGTCMKNHFIEVAKNM